MKAEIITSGTELLLGDLIDTNAPYISRCLRQLGVNVYFRTTVGDNESRIADAVSLAMSRADLVIVTGGLGPTVDDVTRQAVASATGRALELRPELVRQIEERFRRIGMPMTPNNIQQANIPVGAIAIENPVGTAPAFAVETDSSVVICLPGVPFELEYLLEHTVLPYLRRKFGLSEIIRTLVLRTCALGESRIDHAIGDLMRGSNPTVGLNAHPAQTDVRITAKAPDEKTADEMIGAVERVVRERLGAAVFGTATDTLEGVLVQLLADRGHSLVVLEMPTAGEISHRVARTRGGAVLRAGLVSPTLVGLGSLLEPNEPVNDPSFPSADTATRIAHALRQRHSSTCALVAIGHSAPAEGQSPETAVCAATPERTAVRRLARSGRDAHSRAWLASLSMDLLRRLLIDAPLEA
jgi:nicotinamide-nucleotide amidase